MAGGRDSNKRGRILDRTHQWLCHRLHSNSVSHQLPLGHRFKERHHIEKKHICKKTTTSLEENIIRIYTKSLHCDLKIIHGCNVINTNQCIIETRSPKFYEVLKPYFISRENIINCIVESSGLFQEIKTFVRLLYTNVDLFQQEKTIVKLILQIDCSEKYVDLIHSNSKSSNTERSNKQHLIENYNVEKYSNINNRYAEIDVSPTSSDMADSGLETGSVSPHENTTSEYSSTDFDDSHTVEYGCGNENVSKIYIKEKYEKDSKARVDNRNCNASNNCGGMFSVRDSIGLVMTECVSDDCSATCSSAETENQHLDSSSSNETAQQIKTSTDEIFQYENQVLSDPFYESDCGSDDNESFELVESGKTSSLNIDVGNEATKINIQQHPSARLVNTQNLIKEEKAVNLDNFNNTSNCKSSSSTSNYYFIDASSLNDEVEIMITDNDRARYVGEASGPLINFSDYAPSRSNDSADEQLCKFTAFKSINLQTVHERVAEFQRELKLTEHLEPLVEPRKVKRVDSLTDEKTEVDKSMEKESLVVEIKEADSGESTQPSPCPDNNTRLKNNEETKSSTITDELPVNTLNEKIECVNLTEEDQTKDDTLVGTRRSSLIRRNTFELDSNDEKLSALRQEYERRQGSLVFQNSIPQYSGHRVDGDSLFDPPTDTSVPPINSYTSEVAQVELPAVIQYHSVPFSTQVDDQPSLLAKNIFPSGSKKDLVDAVYPVTKSASDEQVTDPNMGNDDTNECSNSLPVTLSSIIAPENRFDSIKRTKRDEATPIISGGVSTSDYSKPTDSPTVRRKTESTPIVSGGAVIMNDPEVKKPKPAKLSTSMTAWVVDMSDCARNDSRGSTSSSNGAMSQSFSSSECIKKPTRKLSQERHGSLGFFVNLKDIDDKKESRVNEVTFDKKSQNENGKSYCEFYVDMSNRDVTPKVKKPEKEITKKNDGTSTEEGNKKNIFSMFIDLSDTSKNDAEKKLMQKRNASVTLNKQVDAKTDDTNSSESSSTTHEDQQCAHDQKYTRDATKASVFMYIDSDSPVVRRRTLSTSRSTFKRHSWNVDKQQSSNVNGQVAKEIMFRKEHKRAHSLSVDRAEVKKLQAKPSSSSHSLSDAAKVEPLMNKSTKSLRDHESNRHVNMDTSTEDVFEFDMRDTPPNSHVEIINEEILVSVKQHEYKELGSSDGAGNMDTSDPKAFEDECSETSAWDKTCTESTEGQTRKSETFDISSGSGSGPSPGSDNNDYDLSDTYNGDDTNINNKPTVSIGSSKIAETHKSLNETIKKIESELSYPIYEKYPTNLKKTDVINDRDFKQSQTAQVAEKATSSFVRLSDLDKSSKPHSVADVIFLEEKSRYRMSNSIPETSWIESKLMMSRTSGPVRTLPRKLTSVMSTSLPSKQKSPLEDLTGECEGEGIISESDLSSMQSSMGRSGAEGSTEETETSSLAGAKPYNRLGEDLLRMFLEEINPDVIIDVAGRRIRAHKCILSSRCQYFAAILSGGWVESAGNIISLQGYSYQAVHFALCHIYSGESNIPESISIVELATLADMLCLEGLKEVIGYTLKVKYCHLFHKPCQVCAVGVLECMPLAAAYGLDEVYRKSLRWITRHFVRIWPTKAFATLPRELTDKCYHQHIVHMSTDNVLQTMMDCDKLLATLPNVRWAEPVFRMVSNLLDTAVKFLSDNLSGVLGNENFQSLGRELTWNISRLEDNFLAAAERLPPEQACKSYSKLHKMLMNAQSDDPLAKMKWGPLFVEFLKKIQTRVEKCLIRDAARAARTNTWLKMDLELRRRIQEMACLVILPHETIKRPSRHSNFLKEFRTTPNRTTASRSLDLKRVKMVISEHNDKSQKQVTATQLPKRVLNKPKSDPLERKVQEEKQSTNESTFRPKSWPNKIEVKSRYLEPRKPVVKEPQTSVNSDKVTVQPRRKIMISSSDSSRTSSPAMKRASEKKPLARMKLPVKKDVKALSSDSLTESNSANAVNKKDSISKSCGITRPESPSLKQKSTDIGLSVDSLAESKKKPIAPKKKIAKMDTSMSADSLTNEISGTPKSNVSNKQSPTLGKVVTKTQNYDRTKKNSPPLQQRSPLVVTRRPIRSIENSTAASRSRAAAISAYHGSPSLRRSLLDAAKTPDIPTKSVNSNISRVANTRQVAQSLTALSNVKREKKDVQNQQSPESQSKKSSPKLSGSSRLNKTAVITKKPVCKVSDDKFKTKCHNGETPKQLTVGSRSGTFLKDEPTILKRADIKTTQINT